MTLPGTTRALLGATRAILRPLVRQLIAHGITYPAFSRLAKEVYIEVGRRHFTLDFKKQTDSRVALVTGITRKEIGQLRRGQAPQPTDAIELDNTLAARVVGRWLAAPPYADAAGRPYVLPYEAGPTAASFVALVGELGGDIPPRAVLDELLRAGAARLTPRGDVQLLEPARVSVAGAEQQVARLGSDAAQLIEAIARAIDDPGSAGFLARTVRGDDLGADALRVVRARIAELGAQFAAQADQVLAAHAGDEAGGERCRALLLVYYFETPVAGGEEESISNTDEPG